MEIDGRSAATSFVLHLQSYDSSVFVKWLPHLSEQKKKLGESKILYLQQTAAYWMENNMDTQSFT